MDELLNTAQFAQLLGVSTRRARAILASGALPFYRIGRQYAVAQQAAIDYASRERKSGRPRKA